MRPLFEKAELFFVCQQYHECLTDFFFPFIYVLITLFSLSKLLIFPFGFDVKTKSCLSFIFYCEHVVYLILCKYSSAITNYCCCWIILFFLVTLCLAWVVCIISTLFNCFINSTLWYLQDYLMMKKLVSFVWDNYLNAVIRTPNYESNYCYYLFHLTTEY